MEKKKKKVVRKAVKSFKISKENRELLELYFDDIETAIKVMCVKLRRCPSFFLQEKVNMESKPLH